MEEIIPGSCAMLQGNIHLHIEPVLRTKGQSLIMRVAYQTASVMRNPRTGQWHNFRYKRKEIGGTLLITPQGEITDQKAIAEFWGKVEAHHKRKDAVPGRTISIALPCELSRGEKLRLMFDFGRWLSSTYGIGVQVAAHELSRDNPHFHAAMTSCSVLSDGTFGKKVMKLDPIAMQRTGEETPAETLRAKWADMVNRAYADSGVVEHVDHRSYLRRGISKSPTVHEGVWRYATCPVNSPVDLNHAIRKYNSDFQELEEIEKARAELQIELTEKQECKKETLQNSEKPKVKAASQPEPSPDSGNSLSVSAVPSATSQETSGHATDTNTSKLNQHGNKSDDVEQTVVADAMVHSSGDEKLKTGERQGKKAPLPEKPIQPIRSNEEEKTAQQKLEGALPDAVIPGSSEDVVQQEKSSMQTIATYNHQSGIYPKNSMVLKESDPGSSLNPANEPPLVSDSDSYAEFGITAEGKVDATHFEIVDFALIHSTSTNEELQQLLAEVATNNVGKEKLLLYAEPENKSAGEETSSQPILIDSWSDDVLLGVSAKTFVGQKEFGMQKTASVDLKSNLSHEDATVLKSSDRSNSLEAISVQTPVAVSDLSPEDEVTVKVNEDEKYSEIAEMVNQESKSTVEEQQNVFDVFADLYGKGEILLLSDDQKMNSALEETIAQETFIDTSPDKKTMDVDQSSTIDSGIESFSVVSSDSSAESECPWHETAWQEIKDYAASVEKPSELTKVALRQHLLSTSCIHFCEKHPDVQLSEITEIVNLHSKSTVEERQIALANGADFMAGRKKQSSDREQENKSTEAVDRQMEGVQVIEPSASQSGSSSDHAILLNDIDLNSSDAISEPTPPVDSDSSTESEYPWHETAWQEIKGYAASVEKPAELPTNALREHVLGTSCIQYCLKHPDVQFSAIAEIVHLHSKSPADVQQRAIARVADFIAKRDNPDVIKSLQKTSGTVPEAHQLLSPSAALCVRQHVTDFIVEAYQSLSLTTNEAPETDMVDSESVTDKGGELTTRISGGEDVLAGSKTVAHTVSETSVERGPMASTNVTQAIHEAPEMRRSIVPSRIRKPSKWREREEKKVWNRPWHRVHWKYMVRTNHIMKEVMKAPRIEILYTREAPPFRMLRRSWADDQTITPTM